VAVSVNSSLTLMYWYIGKQIDEEVLGSERGEYGKRNLLNMVKFFKKWSASKNNKGSAFILDLLEKLK